MSQTPPSRYGQLTGAEEDVVSFDKMRSSKQDCNRVRGKHAKRAEEEASTDGKEQERRD